MQIYGKKPINPRYLMEHLPKNGINIISRYARVSRTTVYNVYHRVHTNPRVWEGTIKTIDKTIDQLINLKSSIQEYVNGNNN
jgi:hypothetical protein